MGKGGRFRGRFDFDFLHFLAHFSSGSQFLSGRHIEQSIPDIRREKGEEDVSRVVSSPVHTDNWVVRESFIVQGARLFIPFHSISLHRIPSFDRKRRENDGSQYAAYIFIINSHIFIYFLLVYFSFSYLCDLSWRSIVEDATRWSEQPGNADLGRHMQLSHGRLSSYILLLFFCSLIFFHRISFVIFIIQGYTTSKRSNIEHRKLVCVLMPRADRYMSGDVGEVCVRRPRSRCGTYKASVNIVHIRCQWKLRDIRLERRVPYKESRDRGRWFWSNVGIMLRPSSSCFKLFGPLSRDRQIHHIYYNYYYLY